MTMDAGSKVSVVIVNYNAGALLAACLSALTKQDMPDFEAIIVDNASADGSIEGVSALLDERFTVLPMEENLGFAAGTNRGAELASAPWIAALNPDAVPAPDWLSRFLEKAELHPDIAFFGSLQIDATNKDRIDGMGDCYHALGIPWRGGYGHQLNAWKGGEGEVFGPCAAAAFYKAKIFREIGGFDESFFCYCEDVDLAFRLRLRGHRCLQLADARVYHVGSAITGKISGFALYHSVRNRLWIVVKDMPWPLLIFLLPLHIVAVCYLLVRCRGTPAFLPQWQGLKSGFAGFASAWKMRSSIQAGRRVSSLSIAKSFSWPLGKLRRLEPDIRPWSPEQRKLT